MALRGRSMPPKHKHRLAALKVQLFEQLERFLVEAQTALLVAVDDVERILTPGRVDVVFLERGGEDFVAGVVDADAELFDDVDAGGLALGVAVWRRFVGLAGLAVGAGECGCWVAAVAVGGGNGRGVGGVGIFVCIGWTGHGLGIAVGTAVDVCW